MTKHAAIYPSEDELQSIQKIVSITERALKLVSDIITDQEKPQEEDKEKTEPTKDRCSMWSRMSLLFSSDFCLSCFNCVLVLSQYCSFLSFLCNGPEP